MNPNGATCDLATSQYSPQGFIFQLDYAEKCVEKSVNVIGLRSRDAVVLAVEKTLLSPMYENDAAQRVFQIQKHIAMAFSGFWPDGNHLVELARQESIKYHIQFDRLITLELLAQRVGDYMHAFTLNSAVRPFGVNVLIASWDAVDGAKLYKIDNSGTYYGYYGCASGKAATAAKAELEKLELDQMHIQSLAKHSGKIIYGLHDRENGKPFHLEMAVVGENTGGVVLINPQQYHRLATRCGQTNY